MTAKKYKLLWCIPNIAFIRLDISFCMAVRFKTTRDCLHLLREIWY